MNAVLFFEGFASFFALISASSWYRASRALDQHGINDPRFKHRFSLAMTGTMLTFGLAGMAGFLLLVV